MVTLVDCGTFIADYASRAPLAARPELGEGGNMRPVVDLLVEQVQSRYSAWLLHTALAQSGCVLCILSCSVVCLRRGRSWARAATCGRWWACLSSRCQTSPRHMCSECSPLQSNPCW